MSELPSSAQDFELRSCKIFPNDGRPPINVGLSLINYFIYSECITTPFISSRMEIVDGGGLLNAVPIQGMEKVEVICKSVISDAPEVYVAYIFTVQGRYAQNNVQTYTIGMISKEALVNETIRLNEPLQGKGDHIMKKLLVEKLETDKEVFSEPTLFENKILPGRRRPFDIIASLAQKGVSHKATYTAPVTSEDDGSEITKESVKGSAGYYFWENKRGYNFFSLDALADVEGNDFAAPDLESQVWGPYAEQIAGDENADNQFNIQYSMFGSDMNLMESLRKGKYASTVALFNISTGFYEEATYKIGESWDNMAHLGGQESHPSLPSGMSDLSKNASRVISAVIDHETWYNGGNPASPEDKDGATDPTPYADWAKYFVAQSITRYELMKQQVVTIVISGNAEICAGDKIDIRLKSKLPNEETQTQPYDPESSGVYLVYEVAHNYSLLPPSTGNGRFNSTLILVRDSYGIHGEVTSHDF